MKLLAVFLLAALGCGLTEGRIVSKCDLKNQLVKATGNLTVKPTPKGPTVDKLVAKIVCHAEHVSGFNTSAVKELIGEVNIHPGNHSGVHEEPLGDVNKHLGNHSGVHEEPLGDVNKHLGNHSGVHEDVTGDHDKRNGEGDHHKDQTGSNQPRPRHRRHNQLPSLQARPASPPQPAQNCTLYGIFQLSSCQVCSDGTTPSANICGMDCSKLLDDDVSDDIGCVLKILPSPSNKLLVKENCENVNPSVYLAGCSST